MLFREPLTHRNSTLIFFIKGSDSLLGQQFLYERFRCCYISRCWYHCTNEERPFQSTWPQTLQLHSTSWEPAKPTHAPTHTRTHTHCLEGGQTWVLRAVLASVSRAVIGGVLQCWLDLGLCISLSWIALVLLQLPLCCSQLCPWLNVFYCLHKLLTLLRECLYKVCLIIMF